MIIKTADFFISSGRADQCPADSTRPEYAFIGRSNVGKSSLINMLTGRKGLAMTSSTPGKTLLINHFLINDEWFLVDLPGYGYATRGLFVLIDSRLPPQTIDLEFIEWLGEEGIPFGIIFTKADKNKRNELKKNVDGFLNALRAHWDELPPHFVTSSEKGTGRNEVLDYIEQINHDLDQ